MSSVKRLAMHLRKFLLLYLVITILIGLAVGYFFSEFFTAHISTFKYVILALAIGTLYPSMIQLKGSKIGKEFRIKWREAIIGLLIMFLVSPLVAMGLAGEIGNRMVSIGYVAANSVPASSASIAYVLLAQGNIELATLLVILSLLIALVAAPFYVSSYAQNVHVNLPIALLAKSVMIALALPLVLGQITRYYLIERRARIAASDPTKKYRCKEALSDSEGRIVQCIEENISKRLKPILSVWTMLFLFALVFTLIAVKARLLVQKPMLVAYIFGAQLVVYSIVIVSLMISSKILRIRYADHMALAPVALTKNQSVAAAMAVMAIGPTAAIPASLIPAIQPVVAILYIYAAPVIKRILGEPGG
ncbi:MAG: arsenic resistance protein [Thaumarchaeota archaeon]|nr:arsenic resistance protein [Nitrososphaerota archaeon]